MQQQNKKGGSIRESAIRAVVLILIICLVAILLLFVIKPKPVIPKAVDSQLNFSALIPTASGSAAKIDKKSFKYDSSSNVMSFVATEQGTNITITEQAYPDVLIYDKLVGTLNQYGEVQTRSGKVALTQPKNLHGGQTAVLSTYNGTSGVLLFATPDKNLTNDQWIKFFNELQVVQ